jgi:hypothetical protein
MLAEAFFGEAFAHLPLNDQPFDRNLLRLEFGGFPWHARTFLSVKIEGLDWLFRIVA